MIMKTYTAVTAPPRYMHNVYIEHMVLAITYNPAYQNIIIIIFERVCKTWEEEEEEENTIIFRLKCIVIA